MSEALVVLTRSPRPGTGKTRLRATLARCEAALVDRLVSGMVEDTLGWSGRERLTLVAGRGDQGLLRQLAPAAVHVMQPDAPFWARIERSLAAGLAAGCGGMRRAVLVGSDSPTLPDTLVDAAFDCLARDDDVVIVPAVDGGWVALGVASPLVGALAGAAVRWSTADAAADTVRALRAAGRRVALLPPWYDVDDDDGLERLAGDRSAAARAPRSVAALGTLRTAPTSIAAAP